MSDPFRLRILKNLTAALETITVANGYTHELAGKVFRGRTAFGESDPIPMVVILEGIEQEQPRFSSQPAGSDAAKEPWELLLQGFVEDDPLNPTDPAHVLMAEVKKRLAQERTTDNGRNILGMGGKVMRMNIGNGVVRPPDDISNKAYFWLRVSLMIVEDMGNP